MISSVKRVCARASTRPGTAHTRARLVGAFAWRTLRTSSGGRECPAGGVGGGAFAWKIFSVAGRGLDGVGTWKGYVDVTFVEALRGCERELTVSEGAESRTVRVKIPPGIQSGKKVRVRGRGQAGPAGPGDLLLTVRVREHEAFWYEDDVLQVRVPVTPLEAYAGAKVAVPTPEGEVRVTVRAGSQSGDKLRLRGRGARKGRGEPGDLIVHLVVRMPAAGSQAVEEALAVVEDAFEGDVRASLTLD